MCEDTLAIPSHVAFSELSCELGNEAFGCLVRAALWRTTHEWKTRSGDVEYFIPRAVAHAIGSVDIWDRIVAAGVCIEHSVDNVIKGYLLDVNWPVVVFNEANLDYRLFYPAVTEPRKYPPTDAYGGIAEEDDK